MKRAPHCQTRNSPAVLAGVKDVLRSPGRQLDGELRAIFEPRLGHDFSKVRVHTDPEAAASARSVRAHAYTVGNDVVFAHKQYAPHSPAGQRLIAHELAHVVEQTAGGQAAIRLQRYPVFSDESCDDGNLKEHITEDVEIAGQLVQQAVDALADPTAVAGPLDRFFHLDVNEPGHVSVLIPMVRQNLSRVQARLQGPMESFCVSGREADGARAYVTFDLETKQVDPSKGVSYNQNMFSLLGFTTRTQIVNSIIHEYTHLEGIGHGEAHGEDISDKNSLKVRGLDTFEAMNSAETYMRFVRAVT